MNISVFQPDICFSASIHLSDTQVCEKPSRNKLRYVNAIKSELAADFQQPFSPGKCLFYLLSCRETCIGCAAV